MPPQAEVDSLKREDRVIVALDTGSLAQAKEWVSALKDQIKIFKVGSELYTSCGPKAIDLVREAGCQVFLDLKYHDIPNTVAKSIRAAVRQEVFMLNVHASGGLQMMQEACLASADEAQKNKLPNTVKYDVAIIFPLFHKKTSIAK